MKSFFSHRVENQKVPQLALVSVSNSDFYVLILWGMSEYPDSQPGKWKGWHFSFQKSQKLFPTLRCEEEQEEQKLILLLVPFLTHHMYWDKTTHSTSKLSICFTWALAVKSSE